MPWEDLAHEAERLLAIMAIMAITKHAANRAATKEDHNKISQEDHQDTAKDEGDPHTRSSLVDEDLTLS